MHAPRICFALSLTLALVAPTLAHADRAPNPEQIKPPPAPPAPSPPPAPAEAPPAPATPAKVEAPAKTETKTTTKTESGGMCRAGAPAGGWELLVLLALGLRGRRRLA